MTQQDLFGFITIIIGIFATFLYVRSILRGESKPHMFTWLVWTILAAITLTAQIFDDAGAGAWATAAIMICSFIVVLLSLKYGDMQRTRSDWVALSFSLGAIIPWILTKDPLLSVITVCLIDLAGYYPTIRKSWSRPHDESMTAYAVGALNLVISLFAMNQLTLVSCLYPLTVITTNVFFIGMCLVRRRTLRKI